MIKKRNLWSSWLGMPTVFCLELKITGLSSLSSYRILTQMSLPYRWVITVLDFCFLITFLFSLSIISIKTCIFPLLFFFARCMFSLLFLSGNGRGIWFGFIDFWFLRWRIMWVLILWLLCSEELVGKKILNFGFKFLIWRSFVAAAFGHCV